MKPREIKFRVWDLFTLKMNTDDMQTLISFNSNGVINSNNGFAMNPVMQFTGLKDKNGKDIYEGDIMRSRNDYPEALSEYDYHEVCFGEMTDTRYGFYLSNYHAVCGKNTFEKLEVIGNIHENSELLK